MPAINNQLSEREQEILCLVATGASNKEIAKELYISTNTVKVHMSNIFSKIGVNSRTEAAMYAVNTGIVSSAQPSGVEGGSVSEIEPSSEGAGKLSNIALILFLVVAGLALVTFFLWRSTQPTSEGADVNVPTSQWVTLASMPTARSGLAVAVYENHIYAIAGDIGGGVTNVVERYDPETDEWTSRASKPTAVKDVGAAMIGGKIYVPGGQLASGKATDILEIYDPREDSWSHGNPLPEVVSAYAIAAYEGRFYLFGGRNGEKYLDIVLEYDPDEDMWIYKTPLFSQRAYASATPAKGNIYLIGGFDGDKALIFNEVYTPSFDNGRENPWRESEALPEGRYGMGSAGTVDQLYIFGGMGDMTESMPMLVFLSQTEDWESVPSQPRVVGSNLELVNLGTKLFAIGGEIWKSPLNRTMAYRAIYIISLPYYVR